LAATTDREDAVRALNVIRATAEPVAAKVPAIGVLFWVIKVLTTGMGEALSDYLGNLNLVLAGVVGVGGFVLAMRRQFHAPRYRVWTYWFAVAMVAVFGTMVADVVHQAGIPYPVTTLLYAIAVGVVLTLWYRSEGTLSIHSITTTRRETYYWLTVLATFALGTAAGDLTAYTLNLGLFSSGVLFAVVMLVPLIGWRLGLNPVVAFWFAYVVTRPLGASFADWFGKDHHLGGLGWGDGTVAAVASAGILVLVASVARSRRDTQEQVENESDPGLELAAS
jgi:uncharacterized membrane-anchored protein